MFETPEMEREHFRNQFCEAVLRFHVEMRRLNVTTVAIVLERDAYNFARAATQAGGALSHSANSKRGAHVTACGVPILSEVSLKDERELNCFGAPL